MFQDLANHFPKTTFLPLDYRPPKWESPMEEKLWYALRYMGLGVETQAPVGANHVDMVVFGRFTPIEVMIECDDDHYHHNLIDEFRDDELLEIGKLPIAHISGKEIAKSSERCALYIAERWFPRIMETHGYAATLEMIAGENAELHQGRPLGFFPVGAVRSIAGDSPSSQSKRIYRDYLRYIVGNISKCNFLNEKEKNHIEEWKTEFTKLDLPKRKYSPQELARFYILLFYHEPDLSYELGRLDNFLENRRKLIEIQEANEAEIPE